MTKFKVGDKVRFIEDYMDYKKGDIVEVEGFWDGGINYIGKGNSTGCYFSRVELVETKPTKNQRITALENEVAELKLIVHELRGKKSIEPSTTNTVEDIIEFEGLQYRKVDRLAREGDVVVLNDVGDSNYFETNKPYKVQRDTYINGVGKFSGHKEAHPVYVKQHNGTPETVDVYEVIKDGLNHKISMVDETIKPLTPNQQRAAIIEKSKKFVEDNKTEITGKALYGKHKGTVHTWRDIYVVANKLWKHACTVEFVVDSEKRTIIALMLGVDTNNIYEAATAKCSPSDVFNEHIGKAIALGRALGIDVSEFEEAVKPNKVVSGMKIKSTIDWPEAYCGKIYKGDIFEVVSDEVKKPGKQCHVNSAISRNSEIIDDTNAIY